MQILTEIIEVSHEIIDTLNKNGFFEEHPFIEPKDLLKNIQHKMQRKWEEQNEILLNDEEFIQSCNEVNENTISQTIESLINKGALNMSIGEDGEILYSKNQDFDIENLFEDEELE